MPKLFTPDYYIHRFNALRPDVLRQRGIVLLLCDIDNTLVAHDEAQPNEEVLHFLQNMKKAGIQLVFISNNVEERVSTFAKALDIAYYPFAMKPMKKTYRKILQDYPYDRKQIAVLGDQMMTDMLGANRMGFYTVLTAPVVERDLTCTKVNRVFENMVFATLKAMGKLTKGEFDE